jgi:heterotetrameric sarcosine oxidase gamma subunit
VSAPDRSRSENAVAVAERPRSLVQLMARKDKAIALAAAINAAFGLDLPPPGRWAVGPEADAIWVQPGGWLLESEPAAPGALRARVAAATEGLGLAVDQSSGRSVIRFAGPPARSALATCCRLDLHPRAFGPGSAAMTRVAHVACGIRLVDATPTFDLFVGSTYARWLIEELLEASARYGVRFEPAPKPYRSAMQDSGST